MVFGLFKSRYANLEGTGSSNPDQADIETGSPLLDESVMQELAGVRNTVNSERTQNPANRLDPSEYQALSTRPIELTVQLGLDFQPGMKVIAQGPHGPIQLTPPADVKPGSSLTARLAPPPDLRVTVPSGLKAGQEMKFVRSDGVTIAVPVPKGLGPGDTFDVTPPSLMVKMPEGAKAGDFVVFPHDNGNEREWCRAQIPEAHAISHGYFAARLPPPEVKSPKRRVQGRALE
mmetsp:Transcript_30147/g.64166  ORF Transcript_30147/g.64166 Transcript_30147/m.64166 type:complete len:232 (+) Transcript_30147:74-769(+)